MIFAALRAARRICLLRGEDSRLSNDDNILGRRFASHNGCMALNNMYCRRKPYFRLLLSF